MPDSLEFTNSSLKLLITSRLEMETEFKEGKKRKSFLWGEILEAMKEIEPDLNMTREQISRKFTNMYVTYKRIKKRNNLSGRNVSLWEYYEQFDEVYGARHSINPPNAQLAAERAVSTDLSSSDDIPSTSRRKRRKISVENETLNFLKEEAKRDGERHVEIMAIEREKMEIERKKIKTMIDLKNILQKLVD